MTLAILPSVAGAHHFFASEYERDTRGTIEGVIVEVAFVNPHVSIAVKVVGDQGEGEGIIWHANTVSPNTVRNRGWEIDTVKVGDRVAVEGFLGRDGALRIWIQSLTLPIGRILYPVGREASASAE